MSLCQECHKVLWKKRWKMLTIIFCAGNRSKILKCAIKEHRSSDIPSKLPPNILPVPPYLTQNSLTPSSNPTSDVERAESDPVESRISRHGNVNIFPPAETTQEPLFHLSISKPLEVERIWRTVRLTFNRMCSKRSQTVEEKIFSRYCKRAPEKKAEAKNERLRGEFHKSCKEWIDERLALRGF